MENLIINTLFSLCKNNGIIKDETLNIWIVNSFVTDDEMRLKYFNAFRLLNEFDCEYKVVDVNNGLIHIYGKARAFEFFVSTGKVKNCGSTPLVDILNMFVPRKTV